MERIDIANSTFKHLYIKRNARAKRLIFRVEDEMLIVTAPVGLTNSEITRYVNSQIDSITKFWQQRATRGIAIGDEFNTALFRVVVSQGVGDKVLFTLKDKVLNILFPKGYDISKQQSQAVIKRGVIRFLKRNGSETLHTILNDVAARLGLKYSKFSVITSAKVLGRCSASGDIALSCQLLVYPPHLIEYVICHELAHLTEMNHSPKFHYLCNIYCGGGEKILEKEFKSFKNPLA